MKTGVRYTLIVLFVVFVLVLAQNGAAWADPKAPSAAPGESGRSSPVEAAKDKGGTVKPPPNHIIITQPGTYSVGGCLIHVVNLEPGITLRVDFIPGFHHGRRMDNDHPRFRSGTCRVTYYENGKKIDGIQDPEQGTVYACFGATRQPPGTVHEWDPGDKVWNHRPTTYEVYDPVTGEWRLANADEPALTCGQANLSGYYLVSSHNQ